MRLLSIARILLASIALGAVLTACGDDARGPAENTAPPATVTGSYLATKILFTDAGGSINLLAGGTQLSTELTPAGTTTGTLVVPAAYSESGMEETYQLDGTYTYDAATGAVIFDQAADTFMRDMAWTAAGTKLNGTLVEGSATLTATLERSS